MSIPTTALPTQLDSTREHYRAIYARLRRMAAIFHNLAAEDELTPRQIATFYLHREPDWSKATARLYRAALAFVFDADNTPAAIAARNIIYRSHDDPAEVAKRTEEMRAARHIRHRNSPQTSARKSKGMSPEDLGSLSKALSVRKSAYAQATKLWFFATTLTGLRPCEWQFAKLQTDNENQPVLVVRNAKNTNGRSHGPTRTIRLGNLTLDDLDVIRAHLHNVKQQVARGRFELFEHSCGRVLRVVAAMLWPRRRRLPTLYTARHIFGADAKKTFSPIEVAALMGHASIDTAYQHYGKRHRGRGGMAVEPSRWDIAAVAIRNPEHGTMGPYSRNRRSSPPVSG